MAKSIMEILIGNLEEKRVYRQMMQRVKALPKDYRYVYKKIMSYAYTTGSYGLFQCGLLDFFEECAADGRTVQEIVGTDTASFCDELTRTVEPQNTDIREQLNREILAHFNGKEA